MGPPARTNSTVVLSSASVLKFPLPHLGLTCYYAPVSLSLLISKRGTSSISMATTTIIKTTIKTTGASGEGRNS